MVQWLRCRTVDLGFRSVPRGGGPQSGRPMSHSRFTKTMPPPPPPVIGGGLLLGTWGDQCPDRGDPCPGGGGLQSGGTNVAFPFVVCAHTILNMFGLHF